MTSGRPYILLSVAASLDGYIDDSGSGRLLLSNNQDFDRVDEIRAGVDAILVGAGTIRADNPRLLVRSAGRRAGRSRRGLPESPIKITLSNSGNLDPTAKFFTAGSVDKLVYTRSSAVTKVSHRLDGVAAVVDAGDPLQLDAVLADLAGRGVSRLMVEGGASIHTLFLTAGLVDELHVVFAPFFVGNPAAPRFVNPGDFPQNQGHRMTLSEVCQIGDIALLKYLPEPSS